MPTFLDLYKPHSEYPEEFQQLCEGFKNEVLDHLHALVNSAYWDTRDAARKGVTFDAFSLRWEECVEPPYVAYAGFIQDDRTTLTFLHIHIPTGLWCDEAGELRFTTLDALVAHEKMINGG